MHLLVHILAFGMPAPVVGKLHLQQQVARGPMAHAGLTLAGQADHLPFAHALRNAHFQLAHALVRMALVIQLHGAQRQGALRAAVAFGHRHLNGGVLVGASHVVRLAATPEGLATTEQLLEEAAVAGTVLEAIAPVGAESAKARCPLGPLPARWRLEAPLLELAGITQLVVGGAPLGVGQHRVGLIDLGHPLGRIGFLADVRVVLACQPTIGLLDLVGTRGLLDPEDLVVILVVHSNSLSGGVVRPIVPQAWAPGEILRKTDTPKGIWAGCHAGADGCARSPCLLNGTGRTAAARRRNVRTCQKGLVRSYRIIKSKAVLAV